MKTSTNSRRDHRNPLASRTLILLVCTAAASSAACGPLAEDPLTTDPAIQDPSADPAGGQSGGAIEASESPLTLKQDVRDYLPKDLALIIERGSQIAALVSDVKAGYEVAKLFATLIGITEGDPGMSREFDRLHKEINRVGHTLSAQSRRILMEEVERVFVTALRNAHNSIDAGQLLDKNVDYAVENAMEMAAQDSAFLRYKGADTTEWWEHTVGGPEVKDGMAYDWRGGFPALMMYASLRTTIMAARDPNFRQNATFDRELLAMQSNLWRHMGRMVEGIKCGYLKDNNLKNIRQSDLRPVVLSAGDDLFSVTCADVHAGQGYQEIVKGSRGDPAFEKGLENLNNRMKEKLFAAMPIKEWSNLNVLLANLQGS